MGNLVDNDTNDDFSNASAEEWSKPSTPAERPSVQPESTDRWGSPTPVGEFAKTADVIEKAKAKKFSPWWILLIVLLVIACCCGAVLLTSGAIGVGFGFLKDLFPSF